MYNTRNQTINSSIRVMHASPNASGIDVYLNDTLISQNLAYQGITPYFPIIQENNNIKVYLAGQTTNPIIDSNVNIPENSVFNVAISGTLPNISLFLIPEPLEGQNSGRACVRFVHLSPNAPAVDITLQNGLIVFSNVKYRDYTFYVCLPQGIYTFNLTPAEARDIILTVPDVILEANKFYTIYILGLLREVPPLSALPVLEPRV